MHPATIGSKKAKKILHGPLVFNWQASKNEGITHPLQIKPGTSLQRSPKSLPAPKDASRLKTLSNYLHGYKVQFSEVTFQIVAIYHKYSAPKYNPQANIDGKEASEELSIGLQVLKDEHFGMWMDPWETPWNRRARTPSSGGHNGQHIFGGTFSLEDNYFSTQSHEGLGWLSIKRANIKDANPLLRIDITQEDGYFRAEAKRQADKYGKKIKLLRLIWRHLLVAALEDLAPRLGYASIAGLSMGTFKYFYDNLFSKRMVINPKTGNKLPLYDRVHHAEFPYSMHTHLIFDAGDTLLIPRFRWLYNFGDPLLQSGKLLGAPAESYDSERLDYEAIVRNSGIHPIRFYLDSFESQNEVILQ